MSDYHDHVPLVVWDAIRAYVHLRYALGVPVIPEGVGVLATPFWAYDALEAGGVSAAAQFHLFPLLVPLTIITEFLHLLLTLIGANAAPQIMFFAAAAFVWIVGKRLRSKKYPAHKAKTI